MINALTFWGKLPTQKVSNTASQIQIYYDEGTNNLGKVTNTSCNSRFTLNVKSMLLQELLKFLNPQIRMFS